MILFSFQSPKVGSTIHVAVKGNALLEPLNVVVFGKTGIVYSKVHKDAQYESKFNISFVITSDMAPKADVIIFYLREQDGSMIFDQFELDLGFKSSNFVSINY